MKMSHCLGAVLLLAGGVVQAAGSANAGKTKALICQPCHGPDGNSPYNPAWANLSSEDLVRQKKNRAQALKTPVWPKLAGQNALYLVKQLTLFKSGGRTDPIMSDMAAGLSATDIEDIAAYYSGQKARVTAFDVEPRQTASGKTLYFQGNPAAKASCASCHGPDGHGTPELPRIASQHAIYIRKQLLLYKAGRRGGEVMRPIASQLSEGDIEAVAQYLASLE